jgi:exodeoxyribonuclease VII large subunit
MSDATQLSLYELQNQIKLSLDESFSMPVWVKAEISELTVNRSGHCYLDLVETEANSDEVIARCRATIWSYTFRMLKPYFETTTGQVFTEGLKVLLQAKIEYHEVYGLSLNVRDIDPVYTMGDMAKQRREIIRRLQEDGVIDMNKELELPAVAQRIAIISSPTAAGYEDFLDQLKQNLHHFVFYTKLFPAVMQGNEAPRSITEALEQIFNYDDFFDVVVIIRGGGSQIDLACFDHYELALNVAQFPIPVITGIGHEKDDTVIDVVAHTRMKTPTAVAEFLISGALQFSLELNDLEKHFIKLIDEQLSDNRIRLENAVNLINSLVNKMIDKQTTRLKIAQIQLDNQLSKFLSKQMNQLRNLGSKAQNLTKRYVSQQKHLAENLGTQLNYKIRGQIIKNATKLAQFKKILTIRSGETFRAEKKMLHAIEEKLRLIDPKNILQRGYSLTMVNGKIIKSVSLINQGDNIETHFSDGTVESKVETIQINTKKT